MRLHTTRNKNRSPNNGYIIIRKFNDTSLQDVLDQGERILQRSKLLSKSPVRTEEQHEMEEYVEQIKGSHK